MSDRFVNDASEQYRPPTRPADRQQTNRLSRRRIILSGAGIAGLATAYELGNLKANAQTQPEPQPTTSSANSGRFAGKVVMITGATSGIGEATARSFASAVLGKLFCDLHGQLVSYFSP